jgi:hypothetical protein
MSRSIKSDISSASSQEQHSEDTEPSNGSSREEARWITAETCTHILNAVALRDPHSGTCLPQSLLDLLADLELRTRSARRPFPVDRVHQAVELCCKPLRSILKQCRANIVRQHIMQPLSSLRELDAKCIDWISRLPGRNYREKLSGRNSVLGVQRRFTPDTRENRVVRRVSKSLAALVGSKIGSDGTPSCYDSGGDNDDRCKLQKEFMVLCNDVIRNSSLSEVPIAVTPKPNNVLLSDRNYSRIWRAWQWLRNIDSDAERMRETCEQRFRVAVYWTLVARISIMKNSLICDELVRVSDGYLGQDLGVSAVMKDQDSLHWGKKSNTTILIRVSNESGKANEPSFIYALLNLGLEDGNLSIRLSKLTGANFLVPESYRVINHRLCFEASGEADPLRGFPFVCVKLAEDLTECDRFQDFSDLKGIRRLVDTLCEDLYCTVFNEPKANWNFETSSKEQEKCNVHKGEGTRIGLDLVSSVPNITCDGIRLHGTTRLYSQRRFMPAETGNLWLDGRSDRILSPHKYLGIFVGIGDILDADTEINQGMLSVAAQNMMEALVREYGLNQTAKVAYAVPDSLDEFSQRTLRSATSGAFRSAFPIARSVAAALAWQQDEDFRTSGIKDDDVLLVLDSEGKTLTTTALVARYDAKLEEALPQTLGIYWERRPPLPMGDLNGSLTYETLVRDYVIAYLNDACTEFSDLDGAAIQSLADHLMVTGLAEGVIETKQDALIPLRLNGSDPWFCFKFVPPLWHKKVLAWKRRFDKHVDTWCDDTSPFKKILSDFLSERTAKSQCHVLAVGRTFDRSLHGQSWEATIRRKSIDILVNSIFNSLTGEKIGISHGCDDFLQRMQAGVPAWKEWLPSLYMEVIRDGVFDEFQLVGEKLIDPVTVLGRYEPHDIREEFALGAKSDSFRFPLIIGSNNRSTLNYDAFIHSDAFPLRQEIPVHMRVSYRYGIEDSYDLRLFPAVPENAPFTELTVEWKKEQTKSDSQLVDAHSMVPSFPPPKPWSDPALQEAIEWFVGNSRAMIKRCRNLFQWGQPAVQGMKDFVDWLPRPFIWSTRRLWDQGRTLASAPTEVREAFEGDFVKWLLNLAQLKNDLIDDSVHKEEPYKEIMKRARHISLNLLAHFHEDAPDEICTLLRKLINKSAKKESHESWKDLQDYLHCAGYALGDGKGERWTLTQLILSLCNYFNNVDTFDVKKMNRLARAITVASWRHPQFFSALAAANPLHLESLISFVERTFKNLLQTIPNVVRQATPDWIENEGYRYYTIPYRDAAELLLGILRLRPGEGQMRKDLMPNSQRLNRIAKDIRRIDCLISKHKANWPFRSRIELDPDKPPELGHMSDLAYALNCFLIGDTKARHILVKAVSDEN